MSFKREKYGFFLKKRIPWLYSWGVVNILSIDNEEKEVSDALYRNYFIEQLKFGGIESVVCFDEFLNNELREEEYIGSLIGKTI